MISTDVGIFCPCSRNIYSLELSNVPHNSSKEETCEGTSGCSHTACRFLDPKCLMHSLYQWFHSEEFPTFILYEDKVNLVSRPGQSSHCLSWSKLNLLCKWLLLFDLISIQANECLMGFYLHKNKTVNKTLWCFLQWILKMLLYTDKCLITNNKQKENA